MTNKRKRRLYILITFMFGAAVVVALVMYALRQNINLYYAPAELLSKPNNGQRIRLGGMVLKDSLRYDDDLSVRFIVTDFKSEVPVQYIGVLPDLFREGQGVVALGRLSSDRIFIAEQILAKHDEKYMPRA